MGPQTNIANLLQGYCTTGSNEQLEDNVEVLLNKPVSHEHLIAKQSKLAYLKYSSG
jgi:hypothetical protein